MNNNTNIHTSPGGTQFSPAGLIWETQIDNVRNAAFVLLNAQQAEDRAQTLVGNWKVLAGAKSGYDGSTIKSGTEPTKGAHQRNTHRAPPGPVGTADLANREQE